MNNVNLIGRIATDVKQGNGVVSSLLAVHRIYKSRDGQDTDFIPLSLFGKQAENFSKMVQKGQQIGIDGRIKTSEYADENGEKRYGWGVVVNHFYLLNSGEHTSHDSKQDNDNTYKIDRQLDNLDEILDSVKSDKQPAKTKPVKQAEDDESISPLQPLGNNRNNRSHISGAGFTL
jgi:single-strand DNA-binding protein